VEEGEGRRGGGAGAAVGGRHRPVADGRKRAVHAFSAEQGRRVADPWAQGHSNGWRSLNGLET
jgi:hypothetical protein